MECIVPAKYDVKIWKGDSFKKRFKLFDTNTNSNIGITGATIEAQVRSTGAYGVVVLSFTEGDGVEHIDDYEFELDKIVDLPVGLYVWEMEITFYDGTVRTFWAGEFQVKTM